MIQTGSELITSRSTTLTNKRERERFFSGPTLKAHLTGRGWTRKTKEKFKYCGSAGDPPPPKRETNLWEINKSGGWDRVRRPGQLHEDRLVRTSDEDPDVTQQSRKRGDRQGPDNQRRHTLKSSVSTWRSHTRQQRSPQLKLEETHALLPSSRPEGSHVPLSPMAAALSSSLWYALAETQKCPSSAHHPCGSFS